MGSSELTEEHVAEALRSCGFRVERGVEIKGLSGYKHRYLSELLKATP